MSASGDPSGPPCLEIDPFNLFASIVVLAFVTAEVLEFPVFNLDFDLDVGFEEFEVGGLFRRRQLWTCCLTGGLLETFVGAIIVGGDVKFCGGVFDLGVVLRRLSGLFLTVKSGLVRDVVISRLIVWLLVGRIPLEHFVFVKYIVLGLFQKDLGTPVNFVTSIGVLFCFGCFVPIPISRYKPYLFLRLFVYFCLGLVYMVFPLPQAPLY